MKRILVASKAVALLVLLALFAPRCTSQSVPSLDKIQSQQQLEQVITALDAALFDAYNRCDLAKFSSFIARDVEFYHDQGGVTLGEPALTESVKQNICGKVTRELVPGSLQVYPMKNYGAIEIGVHRFHHTGHDDTEPLGEGRFIHLWQYKDGAWKITRVMSYDHHSVPN
jgi:ketosteroid isomerase-like protein